MIVSNSSPLIALGKEGRLSLLKMLFGIVSIPPAVREELLEMKESPEAVALEKAQEEGWVVVDEVEPHPLLPDPLGKGERYAISLALRKRCAVLLDDDLGRQYAELLGLVSYGTLRVLLSAAQKKILNKKQARLLLDSMIAKKFYISIAVYQEFLHLLEDD
ncbi:DUF3368 domain-containing protein [Candidatus Woesearchaeota archaeon]|nr:DUF3368 domain-containing protein [Candidatus Woesearchaeota archaeon]